MANTQLVRDDTFKSNLSSWKRSNDFIAINRALREMYEAVSYFGYADQRCDVIKTPTYHMFVLHPWPQMSEPEYAYLIDYWCERIKGFGYILQNTDIRTTKLDGGITQKVYRHYLKPDIFSSIISGDEPDRKFGNVSIEQFTSDDETDFLKVTLAFYFERNRTPTQGLDKLMEQLLKP